MRKAYRLAEIAERFGGELVGSPDVSIEQVATLQSAGPRDISFLTQGRYRSQLASTRAGALILPLSERDSSRLPRIICEHAYLYFAKVSRLFNPEEPVHPGIHASAVIAPGAVIAESAAVGPGCHVAGGAVIGEDVSLGAGCSIGEGAEIGESSRLYPRVTVYPRCVIGRRVLLHSGVVIGADGFGFADDGGRWLKIPQTGRVVIGDDVEIGANTTVDRGALDDTVIEEGVKLDNQIQVGHNVRIGAHTAMAGCVGIAGSATIGRHCTIGGAAIIVGHLSIADHVNISAGTLVSKSITVAGTYTGVFPMDSHRNWSRNAVLLRHLGELSNRLRALENKEKKS
jgi:UDP-3-O-[3-hydroxymyristoyl] glucosamine N-acyltransferase